MAPEMNTHAVENLSQKTQRTHAKKTHGKNAKSRLTTSGYEHQHAGTSCSEIRARYHPNPTPDRWPLESLPLGSETGIQVSAVVGIGDHLGRQLPVSLLVPVSVASVDTTQARMLNLKMSSFTSMWHGNIHRNYTHEFYRRQCKQTNEQGTYTRRGG